MIKNNSRYFFFFLLICAGSLFSQRRDTIRFKKDNSVIYFFQQSGARDTVIAGQGDVFYLLVPDTYKPFLSIQTENAMLKLQANDSLVKLIYMKGYQYESLYLEREENVSQKVGRRSYEFKTFINGTSASNEPRVKIRFIDIRDKQLIFSNTYCFDVKK